LLVGLAKELRSIQTMPQPTNSGDDRKVVLRGLVRAETMVQIALALPLSTLIGWGLGVFLNHKLHQSWIAIVGLLLGIAAGFVQVVRLANHANRSDDN
jgi:ATP synthase protein I